MKGNILHLFLFFMSLSLFLISCAGSPEPSEIQAISDTEDSSPESSESGGSPGGNIAEDSEETSVPVESVETDSPTAVAEPVETAAEEVLENTVKPPNSRNLRKRVEKPVEPGKPVPEENIIVSELVAEAVVPEPVTPETSSTEKEIPVEEPTPAVVPVNPLLTEDKEYQAESSTPHENVQKSNDTENTAENTGIPAERIPDTRFESGAVQAAVVETAVPEELNNPAAAAAAPSRILENPGEFTITMEGLGWIFRSDRSTPGSWRFMERTLNGNSTNFRFMFTEPGSWNLVFQRQDLSSGGSEEALRKVVVGSEDGIARMDNGPPPEPSENAISGILPGDADSRNTAAGVAQAEGRPEDAMKYWEVDAHRDDEAGKRARASLVENAVATESVNPLITWLPRYLKDNPDNSVLAGALDIFFSFSCYDEQCIEILEILAVSDNGDRKPEWLYRLASYLEKPGENRDLDRSASLYQEVINRWPLSSWRDKSEERLLWLQRHYFRVR